MSQSFIIPQGEELGALTMCHSTRKMTTQLHSRLRRIPPLGRALGSELPRGRGSCVGAADQTAHLCNTRFPVSSQAIWLFPDIVIRSCHLCISFSKIPDTSISLVFLRTSLPQSMWISCCHKLLF